MNKPTFLYVWATALSLCLMQSVLAQFSAPAKAKNISLRVEIMEGLPLVPLDAQRMTQVLANLLANARAHTPAGTKVETALSAQDGWAVISVTGSTFDASV